MISVIPWYYKAAAVALVIAGVYGYGRYQQKHVDQIQQMKDTVEAFKNRGDIDARTRNLSDYDLCVKLGGLPDTCAELRGLDATTESK